MEPGDRHVEYDPPIARCERAGAWAFQLHPPARVARSDPSRLPSAFSPYGGRGLVDASRRCRAARGQLQSLTPRLAPRRAPARDSAIRPAVAASPPRTEPPKGERIAKRLARAGLC